MQGKDSAEGFSAAAGCAGNPDMERGQERKQGQIRRRQEMHRGRLRISRYKIRDRFTINIHCLRSWSRDRKSAGFMPLPDRGSRQEAVLQDPEPWEPHRQADIRREVGLREPEPWEPHRQADIRREAEQWEVCRQAGIRREAELWEVFRQAVILPGTGMKTGIGIRTTDFGMDGYGAHMAAGSVRIVSSRTIRHIYWRCLPRLECCLPHLCW